MKKRMSFYYLKMSFLIGCLLLIQITPTYALDVMKTKDNESVIPIDYHFAPRYIKGKTTVTLSSAPTGYKWVEKENTGYYQLQTNDGKIIMPSTSYKEKIWAKYANVGFYDGYWLDMKITILNWNNLCRRIEFGKSYIGFGNVSGSDGGKEGWMNVRIDYYYHGTNKLYSGLKGHQPVGDMDYWKETKQGEWLQTGNYCSKTVIIPHQDYEKFDLSEISHHMIGVNSLAGGGTSNSDGSSFIYLFENPSHTITWYGGFLRMNLSCPIKEFEVHFMANGGTGYMDPITVKYGVTTTLPLNQFKKEGYSFNGWHVYRDYDDKWYANSSWQEKPGGDNEFNHYADGGKVAKTSPCGKVYMYACWKPNTYTLTYKGNGGVSANGNDEYIEKIKYDHSYQIIDNCFINEGYVFAGWNEKEDGSGQIIQPSSNLKEWSYLENKVLYAMWEKGNPQLITKENYYYKDSQVSNEEVRKNAKANDKREGDISDKITIECYEYEDGRIIQQPSYLDTSQVGKVKVTYQVINSLNEKCQKIDYIYIIENNNQQIERTSSRIYSRFINDDLLADGKNCLETIQRDSIWLTDDYYELLLKSLTNTSSLEEYDYINSLSFKKKLIKEF